MKKNYFLTFIFLFTSFFTVSAQCNHTFVMIDSYGDGWNGASVDIVVDGEVVAAGIAAADAGQSNQASYENFLFTASTGSNIELANWEAGSWPSEISWQLLDGAGTEIAAGDFYDSGSSVGYCPPPPTCDHTFVMNDSWGDGWNGATVDILVDGVLTVEAAANAASSSEEISFSAAEGSEITLTNWVSGTYDGEISWSIIDGADLELASGIYGDTAAAEANCTEPACYAPQITAWTMNTTGVEFDGTNPEAISGYTVEYSEATFVPGDGTAMTYSFESFPASLDGLTPATTYYFAMQSNCGEGISSDYIPSNDAPAEWTTGSLPPDNDLCENAIPIAAGEVVYGTTNGATDDGGRVTGDVWYYYT